jgi:hypothetical protein
MRPNQWRRSNQRRRRFPISIVAASRSTPSRSRRFFTPGFLQAVVTNPALSSFLIAEIMSQVAASALPVEPKIADHGPDAIGIYLFSFPVVDRIDVQFFYSHPIPEKV